MKKKDFDPNNYNKLNNLRKKIIKDTSSFINMDNKKIIEIGSGNGNFSKLLSKKFNSSYIYGIDIVSQYIDFSKKNNNNYNIQFEKKNIYDVDSTYDIAFMIFSMAELLKNDTLENILNKIKDKILCNGYLILVDEFFDDYSEECDLIGIEVMQKLGYKYSNYDELKNIIDNTNFEIIFTKVYDNKQKMTNIFGSKLQIFYENKLNEFDDTKKYDSELIWETMKDKIIKADGMRTYNKSRLIILKKTNNIIDKLCTLKSDLCLYYSLSTIKDNIKYYKDLKIDNLEYAFPVKTFPNDKILNLFYINNFYFDVSNKNEEKNSGDSRNTRLYTDVLRLQRQHHFPNDRATTDLSCYKPFG